jgi:hypothetical protein
MKWILGISSLFVVVGGYITHPSLARYPRVESYEIRPGILAMPKYAENGEVCQVSIEKLHIQPKGVDLGPSTMPRELVLEMIDELAPPSERGKAITQLAGFDYIDVINGTTDVAAANYENVSVQIYGTTTTHGDIAVILDWKGKACASSNVSHAYSVSSEMPTAVV